MVKVSVTRILFDNPRIKRYIDFARKRGLTKAGAYVRREARQLLGRTKGRGKKSAKPGEIPTTRAGNRGFRFILFAFDTGSETVVVGPAKFAKGTRAAELAEHGGRARIKPRRTRGQRPGRRRRPRRTQVATYAKHPFMVPALKRVAPRIPEAFRGAFR